jgi:GH35 family endo-1,4-beta-xylanase
MKWDATESTRGKFTFGTADQTVKFATDNKILVRGHTTVWHSQLPSWVSQIRDKATLTTVIQDHVQGVMGHFKGQVYAFDVINEMFEARLILRIYSNDWLTVISGERQPPCQRFLQRSRRGLRPHCIRGRQEG